MKILIIGGGGREHALAWKLAQSPRVEKIYVAPGNPGIAQIAECVPLGVDQLEDLKVFAVGHGIDMTVVGPEMPLVAGIVDLFRSAGLRIFGPDKAAAALEGSKKASKEFMMKYGIPTAAYGEFTELEKAQAHLSDYGFPVVIKADGLAAGKGVVIAENLSEAESALREMMLEMKFGDAGKTVVIEEFLTGIEASVLCLVDGRAIIPLESARDYKRALDGDKGLNTGGMGTCSPNPDYTETVAKEVQEKVLTPFMQGIETEGYDYRGLVFIGIMMTPQGIKVLEFNVRFGDPETQSILVRLKSDLADVLEAVCDRRLSGVELAWSLEKAVTVVLASPGYPETTVNNLPITGLERVAEGMVFHAGTGERDGSIVTAGGRVLNLTGVGESYEAARGVCLRNAQAVTFQGAHYRTDIAKF